MLKVKLVSSLEKAFVDQRIDEFESFTRMSALRGERVHFQLLYTNELDGLEYAEGTRTALTTSGELASLASLRHVEQVGVTLAAYRGRCDDNYLRYDAGMYPDLLAPIRNDGNLIFAHGRLRSLWVEIEIPEDMTAGEHTLSISLKEANGLIDETVTFTVDVIGATMPKSKLYFAQWFHCDCLAQYYNVPMWSERHWEIVENFAKAAIRCGINMLLTPVFTPPLDTEVGGERLTTQLVGVCKRGEEYSFDFSLLTRWCDMCDRVGIKYFEIAHLFTQWGAHNAPKIMATVDGEYKKIFGWETDGHGEEYRAFLRAFLPQLLDFMKARGDEKRCFFHISDEPYGKDVESYEQSYSAVADLLEGYPIMDALSNYEYYERGFVSVAIPASNHIQPFLDHKVPNLWTYYCCSQNVGVSNRFIAMPSYRTRFIAEQMYKYDIAGFLHWGFNYYNNRFSYDAINPFVDASGDEFVPAGDMFSVYPAQDGTALYSLRAEVFYDALQDVAAMQLCESLYSKEEIVAEMERIFGEEIVFSKCAYTAKPVLAIRERINEMIAKRI